MFFILYENKLFNHKLKKLFFQENNVGFFITVFFRCFHFIMDFYNFLRVFLLLIASVHFITVSSGVFTSPLILLLFFECFDFTNFLYHDCFLSVTSFLCCCTVSVTDWRELILLSGIFYLTLLPNIWHNLLLSRLPWGWQFSIEDCTASH